jgi:hypothetical protein
MRLAIDIGFHRRDMTETQNEDPNENSAVKETALFSRSVRVGCQTAPKR